MRKFGIGRILCIALCGGVLLQTSGCGANLAPTLANLLTSLVINALLGGLVT